MGPIGSSETSVSNPEDGKTRRTSCFWVDRRGYVAVDIHCVVRLTAAQICARFWPKWPVFSVLKIMRIRWSVDRHKNSSVFIVKTPIRIVMLRVSAVRLSSAMSSQRKAETCSIIMWRRDFTVNKHTHFCLPVSVCWLFSSDNTADWMYPRSGLKGWRI
jgi:hypothetical protein